MTEDEARLFAKIKDEAMRVFGADARVYAGSPAVASLCEVTLKPSSRVSSFVLRTEGTTLAFALLDMHHVLDRLQSRKPTLPASERAKLRPEDFFSLPASDQWAIDKRLGILDWDGNRD